MLTLAARRIGAPPTILMNSALFAFLHHAAAFLVFGTLFAELILLKQELTPPIVRTLARVDAMYGVAAGVLIVVGLIRVYYTEKGLTYYLHSGAFIAKMLLFLVIGLVSIYPTKQFIAWRRDLNAQRVPTLDAARLGSLRKVVHIELGLLLIVILCAVLMARGIGYLG